MTTNIASLLLNVTWSKLNITGPGHIVKLLVQNFANGHYSDFTYVWYRSVGTSIALANVLMALKHIYVIWPYCKRRFSQLKDRSFTLNRRMTKQRS